ncbi:MAG: hypothetical protein IKP95_04740 [Ruminococcus sp.]|nr:hypothetical protein [Ruminococcus sp.]
MKADITANALSILGSAQPELTVNTLMPVESSPAPEAPDQEPAQQEQLPPDKSDKSKRRKLFKIGIVLFFLALMMILLTLSWFSSNRDVSAGGMGVKVQYGSYEIEVRGDNRENVALISDLNTAINETYQDGDKIDEDNPYYQTSPSKDSIIWRKPALNTDNGHYEDGLEPNSSGKLEFWVVAKEAGVLDPEFTFNIRGFHAKTHTENQGESLVDVVDNLFEINSALETHSDVDATLTSELVAQKQEALSYIRGHILFFLEKDSDGYYSGFLGSDRSFKLSDYFTEEGGTTFTAGEKKKVTVYWKWANTFEQMIFDSTHSSYSPLLRDATSDDRTAVYSFLSPANSSVFDGLTSSAISEKLAVVQLNGSGFDQAVADLSDAYNDADQIIGDMIHYIMIEMTAGD